MHFFANVAALETRTVKFVLYMMCFLFTNLEVSLIHLFVLLCTNWESIRSIVKCAVMLLKLSAKGKLLEECGNFPECIQFSVKVEKQTRNKPILLLFSKPVSVSLMLCEVFVDFFLLNSANDYDVQL